MISLKKVRSEFVNMDLDLKSRMDLDPLVHALGSAVLTLHADKIGQRHWVRLELMRQPKSPSQAIRGFSRIVGRLPKQARKIWDQAAKELDIGVQGGLNPLTAEWVLEPTVVQMTCKLGAQVRFTLYSPLVGDPIRK